MHQNPRDTPQISCPDLFGGKRDTQIHSPSNTWKEPNLWYENKKKLFRDGGRRNVSSEKGMPPMLKSKLVDVLCRFYV